jgi:hypothetical protein
MEIPDPPDVPDDPPPSSEAASSDRPWLQILSNYATILIAVSAVVLSVWEGCEMRQHNRLSVLPQLYAEARQLRLESGDRIEIGGTVEQLAEPTYVLEMHLENRGLGPAVIQQALVYRADAPTPLYKTQREGDELSIRMVDSLWAQMQGRFPEIGAFTGGVGQNDMIRAGQGRPFLEAGVPVASVPDTVFAPGRLRDLIEQYSFVVCYCSVYEEDCDAAHFGAPPPADACTF